MTTSTKTAKRAAPIETAEPLDRGKDLELSAGLTAARIVRSAPGGTYGLLDFFDKDTWISLLGEGHGVDVLNGTILGAAGAVAARGLTEFDLDFPLEASLTAISQDDLRIARRWLATALATSSGTTAHSREPAILLAARGWTGNSLRITSLVLAVVCLAVHSVSVAKHRRR
ncbi:MULTISPECIES: hypothetical protein [unclassified Microbacterium]|uniref:hypothetical protein n=1 Tax=unclassified Microbacterium TaxID=2609290 RepID=UPI000EAA9726|nr:MULTISPECIES: hypothetical protein [unclassified Microbacterium]MBT2484483.1 hypothetical protein [Microbacterium sp. ISL-108]RKN67389.1 hypothetical protein D7252_07210 [Microbacterium sp. CGR2]